jgi:hypothetical protein
LIEKSDEANATQSQSRIFFEKKDEACIHKQNSKKTKNLSRIRRFIRRGAIRYISKFALANLIKPNEPKQKNEDEIWSQVTHYETKTKQFLNICNTVANIYSLSIIPAMP